jgi:hypothetical protein
MKSDFGINDSYQFEKCPESLLNIFHLCPSYRTGLCK